MYIALGDSGEWRPGYLSVALFTTPAVIYCCSARSRNGARGGIPEDSSARHALHRANQDTRCALGATQRETDGCNFNMSFQFLLPFPAASYATPNSDQQNAPDGASTRPAPPGQDTRIDVKSGGDLASSGGPESLERRQQVLSPGGRRQNSTISQPETTPHAKEGELISGEVTQRRLELLGMDMQTTPVSGREGGSALLRSNRRRAGSGPLDILTPTSVSVEYSLSPRKYRPVEFSPGPRTDLKLLIWVSCAGTYATFCCARVCVSSIRIHGPQG